MKLICPICSKEYEKSTGHVNRANKEGLKLYCGRSCAGVGRRNNKTPEQRKEEKRLYDIQRRNGEHREAILVKKKEHYYNNHQYYLNYCTERRKWNMPYHIQYCRSPEYKEWKKNYDQLYLAKKQYGEYAECFLLTEKIFSLIPQHDQIKYEQGSRNKNLKRKRKWKHLMQNH